MTQNKPDKEKKPLIINFSFEARMKTKKQLLLDEVRSPRMNQEQTVEAKTQTQIDKKE